jgi:hypothetical protein
MLEQEEAMAMLAELRAEMTQAREAGRPIPEEATRLEQQLQDRVDVMSAGGAMPEEVLPDLYAPEFMIFRERLDAVIRELQWGRI